MYVNIKQNNVKKNMKSGKLTFLNHNMQHTLIDKNSEY